MELLTIGFVICVIAGTVALVIGIGVLSAQHARRVSAEWAQYAHQRGAQLGGSYPAFTIHAQLDGIPVSLVHHVHYGNKGRRYYRHEAMATIPMHTGDLVVSRQGFLESIGKMLGGQDIQIGDPRFDPRFVVRTGYPDAVRTALTPSAIEALLHAQAAIPDVFIEQNAVRVIANGLASPAVCDRFFQVLARVAGTIGR